MNSTPPDHTTVKSKLPRSHREFVELVQRLAEQGLTPARIARRYGIKPTSLRTRAWRHGIRYSADDKTYIVTNRPAAAIRSYLERVEQTVVELAERVKALEAAGELGKRMVESKKENVPSAEYMCAREAAILASLADNQL